MCLDEATQNLAELCNLLNPQDGMMLLFFGAHSLQSIGLSGTKISIII
jgi:hypothetical protein